MLDVLIREGTVVFEWGDAEATIGIKDGRIAVIASGSEAQSLEAIHTVNAAGAIVVPGGIDPHVHTSWVIPTAASLGVRSADAEHVSRAALYGGTTTIIDFAFCDPSGTIEEALKRKNLEFEGKSYTDYSFHTTFMSGQIPFAQLEEAHEGIEAGFPSFKVWMTNTTPTRPKQKTDFGYVWGLMQVASEHNGILAVHAEDDEIVMFQYEQLERNAQISLDNVHLAHNEISEDISFRRVIRLAEHAGAPIYLMHVSAAFGVEAISEAQSKGLPVFGETLQHFVSFTAEDYKRPNGAIYHTYPSLKSERDRIALWRGIEDGTIGTIATDELCTDLAMKVRGKTIGDVTGGHAGVEARMGLMYSEMIGKRGMDLKSFAHATSTNAAKYLGLYPQKGTIAIGSDADVVVIRPGSPRQILLDDMHETDYSPWEGWEISGWPETTILRGEVVVEKGQLLGGPAGRRVPRKLAL